MEARLVGVDGAVRVAEPVRGVVVFVPLEGAAVPRSGVDEVLPRPLEVTVLLFRLTCALELGAA